VLAARVGAQIQPGCGQNGESSIKGTLHTETLAR
jgi:hypothetical protein